MWLIVRHTIEALRTGQSSPEYWRVIFCFFLKGTVCMKQVKIGLISCVLLFSLMAFSVHSVSAQVAARPSPTPPDVHARVDETVVDSSIPDDKAVDKMLEVYATKVRALEVKIGKLK